jgi:hypothetical protein
VRDTTRLCEGSEEVDLGSHFGPYPRLSEIAVPRIGENSYYGSSDFAPRGHAQRRCHCRSGRAADQQAFFAPQSSSYSKTLFIRNALNGVDDAQIEYGRSNASADSFDGECGVNIRLIRIEQVR